jgi:hypothetical protein
MKWSVRDLTHLALVILFIIKDVFEIGDIETQNHPVDPKPLLSKKLPELYAFSDGAIRCDPSVKNLNVMGFQILSHPTHKSLIPKNRPPLGERIPNEKNPWMICLQRNFPDSFVPQSQRVAEILCGIRAVSIHPLRVWLDPVVEILVLLS